MSRDTDGKGEALRKLGTLYMGSAKVTDELFLGHEFFDPRDLLQVKYEMLRRVQVEEKSIVQTAKGFGFSRPSFYQSLQVLQQEGLAGLIPKRRGPHQAHKLSDKVLDYIEQQQALDEALRARELSQRVLQKFGLSVHPRSIERALQRRQKKGL